MAGGDGWNNTDTGISTCEQGWVENLLTTELTKRERNREHPDLEGIHKDQVQLLAPHRTPQQSHPLPESLVQALASQKANTCTTNSLHRLIVHMFLWQIQAGTVIITFQWYG